MTRDHQPDYWYYLSVSGCISTYGFGKWFGWHYLSPIYDYHVGFNFILGIFSFNPHSRTLCNLAKTNRCPSSKKGFFAWFDRSFDKVTKKYEVILLKVVKHTIPTLIIFVVITGLTFAGMRYWPTAFMPEEDQGWFLTSFQLPSDATAERTQKIVKEFEDHLNEQSDVTSNISIMGWGFSGAGQNVALAFTTLKDFGERNKSTTDYTNFVNAEMAKSKEGTTMSVLPPAIDELGTSSGFSLRLQDKANLGMPALIAAQTKLMEMAAQNKKFYMVYPEGLPQGDNISLKIDREKLNTLGVSFASVSDIISTSMGSMYINDFPNQGRMQQVIVQANAQSRMHLKDILSLKVAGANGQLVSLSEVVTPQWNKLPRNIIAIMAALH